MFYFACRVRGVASFEHNPPFFTFEPQAPPLHLHLTSIGVLVRHAKPRATYLLQLYYGLGSRQSRQGFGSFVLALIDVIGRQGICCPCSGGSRFG